MSIVWGEGSQAERDVYEFFQLIAENKSGDVLAMLDSGRNGTIGLKSLHVTGMLPLTAAASMGAFETAGALIGRGAGLEDIDRRGYTPLMAAAVSGNGAVVDLLLKAGADPKTNNARGETALFLAAGRGDGGIVGSLLRQGADPYARDSRGRDSFAVARSDAARKALEGWQAVREQKARHRRHLAELDRLAATRRRRVL